MHRGQSENSADAPHFIGTNQNQHTIVSANSPIYAQHLESLNTQQIIETNSEMPDFENNSIVPRSSVITTIRTKEIISQGADFQVDASNAGTFIPHSNEQTPPDSSPKTNTETNSIEILTNQQQKHIGKASCTQLPQVIDLISDDEESDDLNAAIASENVENSDSEAQPAKVQQLKRGRKPKGAASTENSMKKPKLTIAEEPIKCDFDKCEFLARNTWSLARHVRIHSDDRPFGCEFCTVRFSRKTTLNRHIKTHHANK